MPLAKVGDTFRSKDGVLLEIVGEITSQTRIHWIGGSCTYDEAKKFFEARPANHLKERGPDDEIHYNFHSNGWKAVCIAHERRNEWGEVCP